MKSVDHPLSLLCMIGGIVPAGTKWLRSPTFSGGY